MTNLPVLQVHQASNPSLLQKLGSPVFFKPSNLHLSLASTDASTAFCEKCSCRAAYDFQTAATVRQLEATQRTVRTRPIRLFTCTSNSAAQADSSRYTLETDCKERHPIVTVPWTNLMSDERRNALVRAFPLEYRL